MPDFPLHVQVAEALGWTELHQREDGSHVTWWGREPHGGLRIQVPPYDRSWCSVGPLIERFKITLLAPGVMEDNAWDAWYDAYWTSHDGPNCKASAGGETACQAVALLVVELHKQGKLPK